MTLKEFKTKRINELKGNYEFISPYHKNKKMLPFNIVGNSYDDKYSVKVDTVEYRGWTCKNHSGNYTLEVIENYILTGFIKLKP